MQIMKTAEELLRVTDNTVIGAQTAELKNSEVRFEGTGNILVLEAGVRLQDTKLHFGGSNSLIYLSANKHIYKLNLTLYQNSVFFCGRDNYMNGVLNVTISEQKHVFLGDGNLFAFGIWIRTADPHLIYSTQTKKRINPSKSVFLGDHIWIGQGAMLLKGTQIASGSILGAMSVCAGKKIPSNVSWAGNPARCVGEDVFWDNPCVHAYDDAKTAAHRMLKSDKFIYCFNKEEACSFEALDKAFSRGTAQEKLAYINKLNGSKSKNRFALTEKETDKKGLLARFR